jgi:membrane protein required for colicin V production
MAVIDIVVLVLLLLFVLLGAVKGIVRDIAMLIGVVAGVYLAWRYGIQVKLWLEPHLHQARLSLFLGHALVFLAVVVAAGLLGLLLSKLLNVTPLGWLDRFLGACVGLVKGAALVWVLVTVTLAFKPEGIGVVQSSRVARALMDGGNRALGVRLRGARTPRPKPAQQRGGWARLRGRSAAPAVPCGTS